MSERSRRNFLTFCARGAAAGAAVAAVTVGKAQAAGRHSDPDYCPPGSSPLCLARGTLIDTARGPVPIEAIRIGDLIRTASGMQPAKWIGKRRYRCGDNLAWNTLGDPVLVERSAIADNVPSRDTYMSPRHHLFLDGYLMPSGLLCNGRSIRQRAYRDTHIEYYNIEFERHEVMYANGLAVESLRNTHTYEGFSNFAERLLKYGPESTEVMEPVARPLAYWGWKGHVKNYVRTAISRVVVDLRDPIQIAYDRLAARAKQLA